MYIINFLPARRFVLIDYLCFIIWCAEQILQNVRPLHVGTKAVARKPAAVTCANVWSDTREKTANSVKRSIYFLGEISRDTGVLVGVGWKVNH